MKNLLKWVKISKNGVFSRIKIRTIWKQIRTIRTILGLKKKQSVHFGHPVILLYYYNINNKFADLSNFFVDFIKSKFSEFWPSINLPCGRNKSNKRFGRICIAVFWTNEQTDRLAKYIMRFPRIKPNLEILKRYAII